MLHLAGVQTYATQTTETSNIHKTRLATGCHKMFSVDYLHVEAKMLKVREHSELLSAQYLTDIWNQERSATPSPQGKPLRDR